MPDWSRRQFLGAVSAAVFGGLAGCGGSLDRANGAADLSMRSRRTVSDYETAQVRNADGAALLDEAARGRDRFYDHLTDPGDVPPFADVAEARELARFVDATDFETESALLLVRPIPECYELRLTSVSREPDGVDSQYCREMRPADAGCDRNESDTVGIAIRLPFAGDSLSGLGRGFRRSCGDRPMAVDFEPVTPASNATKTSTPGTGGETE